MIELEQVEHILEWTPIVDIHTHLFPPEFGELSLWGIDELLTYHYLIAEAIRTSQALAPDQFYKLSKQDQADFIWRTLFVERLPLSEATVGVVKVLTSLGLDPCDSLENLRAWFREQNPADHLDRIFELAGVETVTMTNDPFDPVETQMWNETSLPSKRFASALRLDRLIHTLDAMNPQMPGPGDTYTRANRFLDKWIEKMKPSYVAASFPPDFHHGTAPLRQIVFPTCRRHGLPFAMMIGVKRAMNPALRSAGDGMGVADLSGLVTLLTENPDIRFLVTTLAKENAHHLCVLGRKFSNLGVFGCWWFVNNPSMVEEIAEMRLEMLGDAFIPQHSDARIFEQLIYKWRSSKKSIARSLHKRVRALEEAGRTVTEEELTTTARTLLYDNPRRWMKSYEAV